MDVKDILVAAKRAVEEADIPQDLRSTAFGKAVDLISGVHRQADRPATGVTHDQRPKVEEQEANGLLVHIATKLKVDIDIVDSVYFDENGEVRVGVPVGKLDSGKMAGTKQLALLLAAGRQGTGLEESTSVEKIREVADEYKRYDQANFARTISQMDNEFGIMGKGKSRSVKVSRPGWDAAAALVSSLGGGEN